MVSSRQCASMEIEDVFPTHQYAYHKRLGTCDALLDIVWAGHAASDLVSELAVVQIEFSATFFKSLWPSLQTA